MSQRGIIFHQEDTAGHEWLMNGLVPPLIMELDVDTFEWCTKQFTTGYPDKVRTYTMTNDRYLLKNCWSGPYVKMSLWLEPLSPDVYLPIAHRMESAGKMLKTLYEYFGTSDVLFACSLNPKLTTDLTLVQVTSQHTAATFKIDAPTDLNDPGHDASSGCMIIAESVIDDGVEFYNPVNTALETVTIDSRLLADDFCPEEQSTLKDTLSRVPGEMNERMYRAYMKMRENYESMRNLYSRNGKVPPNLPGVSQPQQSAQVVTTSLESIPATQRDSTATHSRYEQQEEDNIRSTDTSLYNTTEDSPSINMLPPPDDDETE